MLTHGHTDRETYTIEGEIDRQTERGTDRQTHAQTDRQADTVSQSD